MGDDFANRVAHTENLLRSACLEWGVVVAGDGSVLERDAERLLGYSERTLKQQRDEGRCSLPRRQLGNRWRYRLCDLARFIEFGYCDE